MVGEMVMGRFRMLERLGAGGMGTVYRAFDERLQRDVAVKEIAGNDPRVMREAQAAARLSHPGIVTLYELGSDGDRVLLVSELVEGATLAELARSGDLSDREVAELGADLCAALAHAHERGVLHRDVKPHNVIVRLDHGAGRQAKLMDFGIASVAGAATLTAAGEVVGTLAYMAPERAHGEPAAEPADIYSLALTLFELWAGANPVARASPAQTAREIGGRIPPLREYRPELPLRLTDCLDACLLPEPDSRPTLAELRRCLEASIPMLDGADSVPLPGSDPLATQGTGWLRPAQLAALTAWGATIALLSALAGRPGLALVCGALTAPAILFASRLSWAAVPALAPALAAVGAPPLFAAVAGSRGGALERAVMGALGWCWLLVAAAALGLGSRLGLVPPPPDGWTRSTGDAARALLDPLLSPEALLGAAVFALAAIALGLVLRAGHVALSLLGALVWAAGLEAALRIVADGRLAGRPALIAMGALAAVLARFRQRLPRIPARRAPMPGPPVGIRDHSPGVMP
jgi:eukaryotic-like serine/threonine-protein kinase